MKGSKRRVEQLIEELKSSSNLKEVSRLELIRLLENQIRTSPKDTLFDRQSWQLNERIKELKCLYSMMDLLYRNPKEVDSILQSAVNLIPDGFAFPSETFARLQLGDQSFETKSFRVTESPMSRELDLPGSVKGRLTVYVDYKPDEHWPSPFLEEEYELLDMLAKLIAGFYSQYHISGLLSEKEEYLQMFRLGIESSEEAIFITDTEGKIIFINSAFTRIYGYSESEVIGKNPRILKSGHQSEKFYESMWETLLSKEIVSGEIVNQRKDGSLVIVEFSSNPIVNREGHLIGFLAIQHDISERKQMETQLREYEQKLREIVESSSNLFYSHTPAGVITYVSPHTEEFFGVNLQDSEMKWNDFVTDHPVNELAYELTERALTTGEIQPPYEMQLRRDDGDTIWVEVREAPVIRDGKVVAITGSLTDITARKQSQWQLEESLAEKDTLLSEVHHRVKNNLAVVSGLLQLQADEKENHEELANQLLESVVRIKTMANIHEQLYQSSSFSRIEICESIRKLIRDIIDAFHTTTEIQIRFECEPIEMNINQAVPFSLIVNEAITNILKHAFAGRRKGTILVRLKEKSGRIMLAVTDDGVGLPDDFDPDSIETLGLHLIKLLASQIHAVYSYDSEKSGTTFSFTFQKADVKGSGSTILS